LIDIIVTYSFLMNTNPQDLLFKYISGNCTEEELQAVFSWLDASDSNKTELERVRKIWDSAQYAGFNPNVDAAWQKVNTETKSKVIEISSNKSILSVGWISGIAASVALVAFSWFLYIQFSTTTWDVVATTADQRTEYTLPDGSKVWLKESTTLSFNFDDESDRSLKLSGEAFFDVAKMPERPFVISLGGAEIEVVGTSFYAKSIEDQDYQVSVKSGIVAFSDVNNRAKKVILKANEEGILERGSKNMVKRTTANPNTMTWQTGVLVFNKTPMRSVIKDLTNYYNISIRLETDALGNCLITSRFDNQPLIEVLEIIKKLLSVELIQTEEGFTFSGQGC